jgi:hypothetical protein
LKLSFIILRMRRAYARTCVRELIDADCPAFSGRERIRPERSGGLYARDIAYYRGAFPGMAAWIWWMVL